VDKEEFVSSLVDETFVSDSAIASIYFFIQIHRWRLMAGPATFGLMAGVVVLVVGDIRKLATETIQFGLGSVLVNFILPGNLRNAIT